MSERRFMQTRIDKDGRIIVPPSPAVVRAVRNLAIASMIQSLAIIALATGVVIR